ncbi:glycosyltransferase family 39 protein [Planctomycetaceae bacterium]|jgi:4-amino-4-deoxy-L-arabinose transferase-like glycosyltransferase|nr:glycosyltransferase family 39 protein [Planctomycetaceae bacterium]
MPKITLSSFSIAGFLVLAFLCQTNIAQKSWSLTFDETFYLNCALQTVHDGRLDPRISESGVGSLPIQLTTIPAAMMVPRQERPQVWKGQLSDPGINLVARRLNSILIGVPVILIVYFWLFKRHGLLAASTGAAMMAFSPAWIAYSAISTTDTCFVLFSMISLSAISWWIAQPSILRFVFVAISIGLAISSKYSGIYLFPVVLTLMLFQKWPTTTGTRIHRLWNVSWRCGLQMSLLLFISLTTLWSTDWFSFSGPLKNVSVAETPDDSPWIKIFDNGPNAHKLMEKAHTDLKRPTLFSAVVARWLHNKTGHPAYLIGHKSQYGWPWYFPLAWFFKSTPAEYLLTLTLFGVFYWHIRKDETKNTTSRQTRTIWMIAWTVLWLLFCLAKVNIGYRYLLPVLPLTILISLDGIWQWGKTRPRVLAGLSIILISGQIIASATIQPHYLSYFTPAIGGAEEGHLYLSDSNIDWGQDLPALKERLDQGDYQNVLLEYFGTAEPIAYGIEATHFVATERQELESFDVFAISTTRLQGTYHRDSDPFRDFRNIEPIAKAGHSIWLYDLSQPDVLDALRVAWDRFPPEIRTMQREEKGLGH